MRKDYTHLPKADFADIKYVYETNRWDGPLKGHCQYKDKLYFFECFDEEYEGDFYRRFVLIDLTPEQWEEELHWKRMFVEHVGEHCCYEEDGRHRKNVPCKPEKSWSGFYDRLKEEERELIFEESQYTAWFEVQ